MAETAITVQVPEGPFDTASAGDLDHTWGASDAVNGNSIATNGRVLILLSNTQAGAQTVTVTSVTSDKNRTGDITTYSMAAADYAVLTQGLITEKGWRDSSGNIILTTSHADVLIAAIRLPD